jgi:predicted ATPase
MYIENVRIKNLRCFRESSLQLRHPSEDPKKHPDLRFRNVNLLLGDNGSGKTSVMRSLALAVLAPVIRESGFRPFYLVRRTATRATVDATAILHSQDFSSKGSAGSKKSLLRTRLNAEIQRRGDYESVLFKPFSGRALAASRNLYRENTPAFFVVGYGATRRVEENVGAYSAREASKQRTARYQRVAGLFETQVNLIPVASWLPELKARNKGRYRQIETLLNALLPEEATFTGKLVDGDFIFELRGQKVPFAALSDGYRAYIGWICDLLYHVTMTCPSGMRLVENRGLVLVDEVDLYLHPNWQRNIIELVSITLPNLQFVFTSHSPLVASSLQKENIFVMEVDKKGVSVVRQYDERIFGLSADQTLESSYFGLPSSRSSVFLEEVRSLTHLSKKSDSSAALQLMDKVTGIDTRPVARKTARSS